MYNAVADMANDGFLQQRLIACAAVEGIPNPEQWVLARKWELAAHDSGEGGAVAAYEYAVNVGYADVGKREDTITDAVLLGIVQAVHAAETA